MKPSCAAAYHVQLRFCAALAHTGTQVPYTLTRIWTATIVNMDGWKVKQWWYFPPPHKNKRFFPFSTMGRVETNPITPKWWHPTCCEPTSKFNEIKPLKRLRIPHPNRTGTSQNRKNTLMWIASSWLIAAIRISETISGYSSLNHFESGAFFPPLHMWSSG